MTGLPWAPALGWLYGRPRCRARLRRADTDARALDFFGRCDLAAGHPTDHALERGMVVVRFTAPTVHLEHS